jgi:hypothetical protein
VPYPPPTIVRHPSGFIEPCLPSKVARPPYGPLRVHEIKHDGYRLMVRRDGSRVRCVTRNGHDWADRFPAIVDAVHRIKATSFVITRDDGMPDFHALRSRRRGHTLGQIRVEFDLHPRFGPVKLRLDYTFNGLCLPQIKPEHIGDAVHPGSDGTECAPLCLSCGPDGAHRCLEGIIRSSHKQRLSQRLVATTPVPMGMALRAGTRTH